MAKSTDFRYNTGATKVPWAAVGENYNAADLMEIIRFLMQGEGEEYDNAINEIWKQVKKLGEIATPRESFPPEVRLKRLSRHVMNTSAQQPQPS